MSAAGSGPPYNEVLGGLDVSNVGLPVLSEEDEVKLLGRGAFFLSHLNYERLTRVDRALDWWLNQVWRIKNRRWKA